MLTLAIDFQVENIVLPALSRDKTGFNVCIAEQLYHIVLIPRVAILSDKHGILFNKWSQFVKHIVGFNHLNNNPLQCPTYLSTNVIWYFYASYFQRDVCDIRIGPRRHSSYLLFPFL